MIASDRRASGFDFDVNLPEVEVSASEEVAENNKRRRALYMRVFGSPDGQELLTDLVKNFCGPSRTNEPNTILISEGGRRVAHYIQTQVNLAKTEEVPDAG